MSCAKRDKEGTFRMSYQQPGPYPVFPQQQQYGMPMGAGPKPPIPATVQRAFVLMLVGAGLEVVNVATSFVFQHQVDDKINQAILDGQQTVNNSASIAGGAFGAILGVGLWIWMAFANRSGHNWARITGTVFFGISCLGLLVDIAAFHIISEWLGGVVAVMIVEALASWLVGLSTVILLWRGQSSAYFQPRPPQPPYGYPGYPGYPGMPEGFMPGATMPPQDATQQPTDPWATPGAQG
jgi:hypothetical protein